jgi:hypothetical protein
MQFNIVRALNSFYESDDSQPRLSRVQRRCIHQKGVSMDDAPSVFDLPFLGPFSMILTPARDLQATK